jgi:hypothetical protein
MTEACLLKRRIKIPHMPQKKTTGAGRKAASTQAGEFVHQEIENIRAGEHGARSAKQAIAIGLSKARRAGVKLAAPKKGAASEATRKKAKKDAEAGKKGGPVNKKRSEAATKALQREGSAAVSKRALSKQARTAAKKRTPADRSAAAKKAARTRSAASGSKAPKKAAGTRNKG